MHDGRVTLRAGVRGGRRSRRRGGCGVGIGGPLVRRTVEITQKLNRKSCSSRDSPWTDVLGVLIFDAVRILRPRSREVTDHAWPPIDAPPQRWSA